MQPQIDIYGKDTLRLTSDLLMEFWPSKDKELYAECTINTDAPEEFIRIISTVINGEVHYLDAFGEHKQMLVGLLDYYIIKDFRS